MSSYYRTAIRFRMLQARISRVFENMLVLALDSLYVKAYYFVVTSLGNLLTLSLTIVAAL